MSLDQKATVCKEASMLPTVAVTDAGIHVEDVVDAGVDVEAPTSIIMMRRRDLVEMKDRKGKKERKSHGSVDRQAEDVGGDPSGADGNIGAHPEDVVGTEVHPGDRRVRKVENRA